MVFKIENVKFVFFFFENITLIIFEVVRGRLTKLGVNIFL